MLIANLQTAPRLVVNLQFSLQWILTSTILNIKLEPNGDHGSLILNSFGRKYLTLTTMYLQPVLLQMFDIYQIESLTAITQIFECLSMDL